MCMYLLPDVTNMCICNKHLCHTSRFLTTEIQLLIPDVTHELNALSNIRYRNGSSSWHVLHNNRHIETECTPVYMVIRQRRGRDTPWWTYSKYDSYCSIYIYIFFEKHRVWNYADDLESFGCAIYYKRSL